jgi:hypothetical protein
LSRRSLLTEREADQIAAKLDAEVMEGRKHSKVVVRLNGHYVGQFGIRRGTNVGHDYIPKQIHATARQALDLAKCPLSKPDFIALLIKGGVLPPA